MVKERQEELSAICLRVAHSGTPESVTMTISECEELKRKFGNLVFRRVRRTESGRRIRRKANGDTRIYKISRH